MKTLRFLLAVLAAMQIAACSREDKPAPSKPPAPKVAAAVPASPAPIASSIVFRFSILVSPVLPE